MTDDSQAQGNDGTWFGEPATPYIAPADQDTTWLQVPDATMTPGVLPPRNTHVATTKVADDANVAPRVDQAARTVIVHPDGTTEQQPPLGNDDPTQLVSPPQPHRLSAPPHDDTRTSKEDAQVTGGGTLERAGSPMSSDDADAKESPVQPHATSGFSLPVPPGWSADETASIRTTESTGQIPDTPDPTTQSETTEVPGDATDVTHASARPVPQAPHIEQNAPASHGHQAPPVPQVPYLDEARTPAMTVPPDFDPEAVVPPVPVPPWLARAPHGETAHHETSESATAGAPAAELDKTEPETSRPERHNEADNEPVPARDEATAEPREQTRYSSPADTDQYMRSVTVDEVSDSQAVLNDAESTKRGENQSSADSASKNDTAPPQSQSQSQSQEDDPAEVTSQGMVATNSVPPAGTALGNLPIAVPSISDIPVVMPVFASPTASDPVKPAPAVKAPVEQLEANPDKDVPASQKTMEGVEPPAAVESATAPSNATASSTSDEDTEHKSGPEVTGPAVTRTDDQPDTEPQPQLGPVPVVVDLGGPTIKLPTDGTPIVFGKEAVHPDVRSALSQRDNISRRHMTLADKDGSIYVTDLGSTNGTYIDGHKVNGTEVLPRRSLQVQLSRDPAFVIDLRCES